MRPGACRRCAAPTGLHAGAGRRQERRRAGRTSAALARRLDLADGTASIPRTLQRTNSGGLTTLPTKTQSSERRIALPTPCLHSLEHHRDQQRQEREAAGKDWQNSGHVFTRPDGAPIEGATLTRQSAALLHRARSAASGSTTSATRRRPSSWNTASNSSSSRMMLGHAHIGVPATVYAHVRLRLQRDAIDLLGHALRNHSEPATRPDDGNEPPVCAAPVR